MKLEVTPAAAAAIRDRLKLNQGSSTVVRFQLVRPHDGNIDHVQVEPTVVKQAGQPIAKVTVDGIDFYVDFADEWYFSGKKLLVDLHEGQLTYHYSRLVQTVVAPPAEQPSPVSDATTSASRHFEELWD
ncbi:hypothetical protein [uncultured Limosilactobacillus sp.]|uniref:hypothetical protein n=1 Tax=uncultured Limosilactobacillus sp. TaxID=2837629 RepID=UPI0025DEC645|nr:hypothetical protein [uncultured Limosilactobacillus sp.]